MEENFPV